MAVNLSPLAGAGAQFFTDAGTPLTGGLLYTYLAGTTTPAATYTDLTGVNANPNPIVLNAAGRVPNEVWLLAGTSYKFVLKTATLTTIGTWDNIDGVNDVIASTSFYADTFTCTAGQTTFTLSANPGSINNLTVSLDGAVLVAGTDFTWTGTTVVLTMAAYLNQVLRVAYSTAAGVKAISPGSVVDASVAVGTKLYNRIYDSVSVKDFGAVGSGLVDDTAAIQAALNSGASDVYIPHGTYLFSTLTVPGNTRLRGANSRTSILKHTGAATAIQCVYSGSAPDGRGDYIDSGWFIFENFELMVNGSFGFRVGKTRSSFTYFDRLYIRHRRDLEGGDPNNQYFAGSVAIDCDNTPWVSSYATYLSKIHHCLIRGFETAVNLQSTVNAWEINRLYAIECKKQVVLSATTGVSVIDSYFESSVAGAIGFTFLSGGGNQINIVGTGFELTNAAATQYAYSFVGGTWGTITVVGAKYLIQSDGNAVNNRRITGTAPLSFVELGRTYTNATLSQDLPMLWTPGTAFAKPFQQPNFSRFGGLPGGNGTVLLGRGGTDASDGWLENDGAYGINIVVPGSGSIVDWKLKGSDGTVHLQYQGYAGGAGAGYYPGSDNQIPLGVPTRRWTTVHTVNVKLTPVAVSALPAASTIGSGARAFVSDANATTFASVVAGGGANNVPVYSDGTNWRIG